MQIYISLSLTCYSVLSHVRHETRPALTLTVTLTLTLTVDSTVQYCPTADGLSVWPVRRSGIPCQTSCGIRLLAETVSDNL